MPEINMWWIHNNHSKEYVSERLSSCEHKALSLEVNWIKTSNLAHIDNNNNNDSYIALYPVKIYKLAALYIINIKIRLTIKKVQVL